MNTGRTVLHRHQARRKRTPSPSPDPLLLIRLGNPFLAGELVLDAVSAGDAILSEGVVPFGGMLIAVAVRLVSQEEKNSVPFSSFSS